MTGKVLPGSIGFIDRVKQELRFFSLRRMINLLLVELQILCKRSKVYGYPPRVSIETGNICNLKCHLFILIKATLIIPHQTNLADSSSSLFLGNAYRFNKT